MTTTPKVSIIDPNTRHDTVDTTAKTQAVDPAVRDKYVKAEKDDWKALTTPSVIGDMMNEINGVEEAGYYKGPIDAILDSMVMNDPVTDTAYMTDYDLPEVPYVLDLFKDNPGLQDDVKPLVDRYEALKDTLEELQTNALLALKQPMTVDEVKSTQRYLEDINKSLGICNEQIESAKYYLYLEKYREKLAREADDV